MPKENQQMNNYLDSRTPEERRADSKIKMTTTTPKTNNEWEKVIKLNLHCGCSLGVCKKCVPILVIIRNLLSSERQKLRDKIKTKNINGVYFLDNQVEALLKLLE